MLLAIVLIQLAVGERRLGRRSAAPHASPVPVQAVP
jgi:iron(III) transport system permease protein